MAALAWAAARVVKATHELTSGQKLVWLEIMSLDRGPDRCFVSGARLAQRLGMGLENVEKARRELKAVRMLDSSPALRPGVRGASWWPELPDCSAPRTRAPTDGEIIELAEVLDGWIRTRRQEDLGVPQSATSPPASGVPQSAPEPQRSGVPQSASAGRHGRRPASGGGEVGGGDSVLQKSVKTSPSSGSQREDGETEEDGPRARANGEVGAGANPGSANWREFLQPPPARLEGGHA